MSPEIIVDPYAPPQDGGWGIEARHRWDNGAIVLGDLTEFPRYRILSIGGARALGDFEAQAEQKTGRRGEVPRTGVRGGKTITYAVNVEAQSLADLRAAEERLLAAFDPTDEREMRIIPHPDYASGERVFSARCVSLPIADEQTAPPTRVTFGYERETVISLRASDPRVYDTTENSESTGSGANGAINLATNPRGGAGATTGWTAAGMASFSAIERLPFLDGLPKGVETGFYFIGDGSGDWEYLPVTLVSGTQYTFSIYVALTGLTATGVRLFAHNPSGSAVASSADYATIGGFTRLSVTFTAAVSGAHRLGLVQSGAGAVAGYATAAQAEAAAAASDYHDGSLGMSAWSGTAHASTSSRRARRDATLDVAGSLETDPIITITGPATGPAIRHRELDRILAFKGLAIAAGLTLEVDFSRRRALLNGVEPANKYLDRAVSDWWDAGVPGLVPGENTIELYRTGSGDAEVTWRDAYPA